MRPANRRAASAPMQQQHRSQQRKVIEDAERLWLDETVARRLEELKQRTQSAKEIEKSRLHAVKAELIAAEASKAVGDDKAARALSSAREQARLMGMRLEELEDERQHLLSTEDAWQSVEARLRVTAATERCEQLAAELSSFPRDARARLDYQRRVISHDIDALHSEHEGNIVLSRHAEALDSDRWLQVRESVEHLLDASEEVRLTLASADARMEERARARHAAFQDASLRTQATLAPLRQEVAELRRQIEAVQLTREVEMIQKQQEQAAKAKAEGHSSKAPPPVPNGLRLAEQEKQLRADVASLSDELVRLNAEEDALTLQVAQLPPTRKRGGGAAARGAL